MGSVIDKIFGWFSRSRKEEESAAEEEHVAAQQMEHSPGFRDDEYEYGPLDENVDEEERTPDLDYDDEDYDDNEQPEEWVDELEHAPAFKHEDSFPLLQEQYELEALDSVKPMWLREKKEEES